MPRVDGAETEDHVMGDADIANGHSEAVSERVEDDDTASEGSYEDESEPDTREVALEHMRRRGLLPTGCCYDDRMKLHMNADFSPNSHHPEDPRRIHEIFKAFKKSGLVYTGPASELPRVMKDCPTKYMWRIPARAATREEICLAHSPDHLAWVESLDTISTAELRELTRRFDQGRESLYVGSMSYPAALLSAGGAIDTCKHVVIGEVKNAFAVIRPPGHHAEFDQPMGFCFFNNVPVAVRVCQQDFPEVCRKVLVLDWDVHHGNGIQNIFYQDPNVLYISIHVYQNGTFYPGKPPNPMTPDGGIENCGSGPGLGKNINIGWHDQGMGDGEYMAAFQKIVMPVAKEFNPDLVVISAGFDAADGDELGGCFVTPACYAHMTHMLMSLADGKVAVCLEGGYNLTAISNSAVAVARTLMGEPPPKMSIPKLNKEAARILAKVQAYHAPYWECMRPGIVDVPEVQSLNASRLHDVVRSAQRQVLQANHMMLPLYVQRELIFKSFENQVLITPNLHKARRILVIIHDAPQLLAQPDVIDTTIEPHNAWVVDGVMQYIDWAVSQNFGVMDVNIPSYTTHDEDNDAFTPSYPERATWSSKLKRGGKYYTTRNGSALMAFTIPTGYAPGNGAGIVVGHIDALTAKLKPVSKKPDSHGYVQLGVAPYAGALNSTWWDRDLGVGGRVIVKNSQGKIESKLVKLDYPIARIPTLAPHFGIGGPFNKETQMVPIVGLESPEDKSSEFPEGSFARTQPPRLVKAIAKELGISNCSSIINWELELFDTQPGQLGGLSKELLFAPRIDDKLCSYSALEALIFATSSKEDLTGSTINLVGLFDDEEIGSKLRQGAASNLMSSVIERVVEAFSETGKAGANVVSQTYANSFMISADVTHAVNPNFLNAYLTDHMPQLNVGLTIGADSNGHLTTDAVSTAFLARVAEKSGNKLQVFQIRNDTRSGGTVGPMLSSATGIRSIDAGLAQLSMHSIRATCGSKDPGLGVKIFAAFFEYFEEVDKEFAE